MTGSSELAGLELLELLWERIRAGGPITFADFMQITLYHPTHGYYAGRVPSPESDFRTSPSLSPWFGRLIARVLEAMWRQLDTPGRLVVIEVGAGGADLAAAAIAAVAPEVGASMTWRFVEGSPQVAKRQRDRLGDCPIPLEWAGTLGQGPGVAGCVIANEVLDNFPIHLLEVAGGEPREVYVGIAGDRLVELLGPLSLPELAPCAAGPLAALDDHDRFEVCLGFSTWCGQAAAALQRGYLLVIDYGDVEPGLWNRRPAGSLVTYREGVLGLDPLDEPGRADITAHVNFSALERAASDAGFEPQRLVSQRELLLSIGVRGVSRYLREARASAEAEGRHADALALLAERSRVETLAAPGGLGDLLVLIAGKEAPRLELSPGGSRVKESQ